VNSIETKLSQVSEKIDALHAKIEELSGNLSDINLWQQQNSEPLTPSRASYKALNNDLSNHKDVLSDERHHSGGLQDSGANLSLDVQIQRLTAQLTAAYGRIAALEEQLLSRR
jgi:chromosome segregation ATPase